VGDRTIPWNLDVAGWRKLLGGFVRGADRVIAPSQDVASRIQRHLPGLEIEVWSHPEVPLASPPRIARVVTLGNLSREKGLDVVAQCASAAKRDGLPLAFRILGATTEPLAQSPEVPVTVHGSYDEHQLPQLLAAEHADVLFFPAQVPETYSYTLSVALATDIPIVASSLGAFPERLLDRADARLVPWDASADEWNRVLLGAAMTHADEEDGGERPEPSIRAMSDAG
jgi:glycosyltransferase involved in cell wall biosynthesis